ncbi:MAG: hypothetical protein IKV60_01405, partial [Rikenellaceae bacterium]|nr:hypothetical protein [Rikenellaceae bacterium]
IITALTIISAFLGLLAISKETNAYLYISNIRFFENSLIEEYKLWAWLTLLTTMGIFIMYLVFFINWHNVAANIKYLLVKIGHKIVAGFHLLVKKSNK